MVGMEIFLSARRIGWTVLIALTWLWIARGTEGGQDLGGGSSCQADEQCFSGK